ncbi:MAG: SRPBCC family protein [Micropepsaceae bacterium]
MAKTPKSHAQVGEDYLAAAKSKPAVVHRFPFPASAVWAALLDDKAWTEWLPLTKVTWTSGKPFGNGTTRTVEVGSQVVEETFFAWDEGKRMAFRFERSTLPVSAAVEDYSVVDVPGGCELHWWGRASAMFPIGWLVTRQLTGTIKSGLPKLEALIRANPKRFGM